MTAIPPSRKHTTPREHHQKGASLLRITSIKSAFFFFLALSMIIIFMYNQKLIQSLLQPKAHLILPQHQEASALNSNFILNSDTPNSQKHTEKSITLPNTTEETVRQQIILAVQISYWQLTQHYPKNSVVQWLELAKNSIHHSDFYAPNKESLQKMILSIQNNITTTKTTNWLELFEKLHNLQEQIHQITHPNFVFIKSGQNQEQNKNLTTSSTQFMTQNSWHQLYYTIHGAYHKLLSWLANSIQIETISDETYQTLNNTLSHPAFQNTALNLIKKAETALEFHDPRTFQYTMIQLQQLLNTTIVNHTTRAPLETQIQKLLQTNILTPLPDYTPLLQALNNQYCSHHDQNNASREQSIPITHKKKATTPIQYPNYLNTQEITT